MKYPPFCDIIVIGFNSIDEQEIEKVSNIAYGFINSNLNQEEFKIFKPMPSPIDKIQNKYRYRMILKGKVNLKLIDCIKYSMEENVIGKIKDTTITVDINPNNMI